MTEKVVEQTFQEGFVRPLMDADSRPWWDAVNEGRLILPKCRTCGHAWFPPSPGCPRCGAITFEWTEASGRGSLYSWVVINRALSQTFVADTPYTIAAVTLEDGPRVFGRLVGEVTPQAEMPVQAFFYRVEDQVLLGFTVGSGD